MAKKLQLVGEFSITDSGENTDLGIFNVNIIDDGDQLECDTSFNDIVNAYNENKHICCRVLRGSGNVLQLPEVSIVPNKTIEFSMTTMVSHDVYILFSSGRVEYDYHRIPYGPEDIGAQPAGDYLTEVPNGYAKTEDIPTKPEDIGAQPAGNYLTEHQSLAGYATENYVKNQIAEAELSGGDVDLSGYATKDELPTKVSHLQNDSGYLTAVPDGYAKTSDIPTKPSDIGAQPAGNYLTEHQSLEGYAKTTDIPTKPSDIGAQPAGNYLTEHQSLDGYAKTSDIPTKPEDIGAQPAGNYALKTEIPNVPVQSINGKTGAVQLSASDVGALPSTYTPPTQTAAQVGADPKGTATSAVSQHNTADDSHNDIRLELKAINDRLTAFFDSDNQTLDELSEIVTYITNNKSLIDSITTSKVSVADIVNNLTSNVTNKPLSAAQGVALKSLIDGVSNSLANYQPKGNYLTSFTETDPTVPSWAKASSKPSYSKSEVGLGNVDNVKQYSASNPPPYPVTSVNGKTGAVTLDAEFVVQDTAPENTSVMWVDPTDDSDDGFQEAVNMALAQAKASGEFDGKTPVMGTDYFTSADKAEIVSAVLAALPVYTGEVV